MWIWELTINFLGKLLSSSWRKWFSGLGVHSNIRPTDRKMEEQWTRKVVKNISSEILHILNNTKNNFYSLQKSVCTIFYTVKLSFIWKFNKGRMSVIYSLMAQSKNLWSQPVFLICWSKGKVLWFNQLLLFRCIVTPIYITCTDSLPPVNDRKIEGNILTSKAVILCIKYSTKR